ncbi:hypothetical protein OROHE_000346 [Orobanche hederae]
MSSTTGAGRPEVELDEIRPWVVGFNGRKSTPTVSPHSTVFLNTTSKSRPFEYLRLTSLGVICALVNNYETTILPMKRPELFSRGSLLRPCRGILLFGPPGTGKSLLAKAIVTGIKAYFINVSAASITFKWLEKTSNALFSYAKKLAPVVIYLDEVDSLLGARGKNETSILKGFVAAWDGLELKESQRVLVIGGTNRPFDIDEAVICRVPRRIYVGLSDVDISVKMPQYGGGPVRDKYYSHAQYDEVLDDWSQFVYSHLI